MDGGWLAKSLSDPLCVCRPGEAVTILLGECNNTCAEFSYKLSEPSCSLKLAINGHVGPTEHFVHAVFELATLQWYPSYI